MDFQVMNGMTPIQPWGSIEGINIQKKEENQGGEASVFQSILQDTINQVYSTQAEVEEKQYLLATGQLDDAHSLPIAEAKAALSLELMISLRNKAMESYSELMRMSV